MYVLGVSHHFLFLQTYHCLLRVQHVNSDIYTATCTREGVWPAVWGLGIYYKVNMYVLSVSHHFLFLQTYHCMLRVQHVNSDIYTATCTREGVWPAVWGLGIYYKVNMYVLSVSHHFLVLQTYHCMLRACGRNKMNIEVLQCVCLRKMNEACCT